MPSFYQERSYSPVTNVGKKEFKATIDEFFDSNLQEGPVWKRELFSAFMLQFSVTENFEIESALKHEGFRKRMQYIWEFLINFPMNKSIQNEKNFMKRVMIPSFAKRPQDNASFLDGILMNAVAELKYTKLKDVATVKNRDDAEYRYFIAKLRELDLHFQESQVAEERVMSTVLSEARHRAQGSLLSKQAVEEFKQLELSMIKNAKNAEKQVSYELGLVTKREEKELEQKQNQGEEKEVGLSAEEQAAERQKAKKEYVEERAKDWSEALSNNEGETVLLHDFIVYLSTEKRVPLIKETQEQLAEFYKINIQGQKTDLQALKILYGRHGLLPAQAHLVAHDPLLIRAAKIEKDPVWTARLQSADLLLLLDSDENKVCILAEAAKKGNKENMKLILQRVFDEGQGKSADHYLAHLRACLAKPENAVIIEKLSHFEDHEFAALVLQYAPLKCLLEPDEQKSSVFLEAIKTGNAPVLSTIVFHLTTIPENRRQEHTDLLRFTLALYSTNEAGLTPLQQAALNNDGAEMIHLLLLAAEQASVRDYVESKGQEDTLTPLQLALLYNKSITNARLLLGAMPDHKQTLSHILPPPNDQAYLESRYGNFDALKGDALLLLARIETLSRENDNVVAQTQALEAFQDLLKLHHKGGPESKDIAEVLLKAVDQISLFNVKNRVQQKFLYNQEKQAPIEIKRSDENMQLLMKAQLLYQLGTSKARFEALSCAHRLSQTMRDPNISVIAPFTNKDLFQYAKELIGNAIRAHGTTGSRAESETGVRLLSIAMKAKEWSELHVVIRHPYFALHKQDLEKNLSELARAFSMPHHVFEAAPQQLPDQAPPLKVQLLDKLSKLNVRPMQPNEPEYLLQNLEDALELTQHQAGLNKQNLLEAFEKITIRKSFFGENPAFLLADPGAALLPLEEEKNTSLLLLKELKLKMDRTEALAGRPLFRREPATYDGLTRIHLLCSLKTPEARSKAMDCAFELAKKMDNPEFEAHFKIFFGAELPSFQERFDFIKNQVEEAIKKDRKSNKKVIIFDTKRDPLVRLGSLKSGDYAELAKIINKAFPKPEQADQLLRNLTMIQGLAAQPKKEGMLERIKSLRKG